MTEEHKQPEYFYYEQHKINPFPSERFHTEKINGTTYMLTLIPEIGGLWGQYFGQGDLKRAWVRLDIWEKWARPGVVKEYTGGIP